jgi:hypothetical protein
MYHPDRGPIRFRQIQNNAEPTPTATPRQISIGTFVKQVFYKTVLGTALLGLVFLLITAIECLACCGSNYCRPISGNA